MSELAAKTTVCYWTLYKWTEMKASKSRPRSGGVA
jgi:hypothetical protein